MTNILYIIFISIALLIINGIAILFNIRKLLENYDMLKPEYYSQINLATLFRDNQEIIPKDQFSVKEISKIRKLLIREFALLFILISMMLVQFSN